MKITLSEDLNNKILTLGVIVIISAVWFLVGTFTPYKWLDPKELDPNVLKQNGVIFRSVFYIFLAALNGAPYVLGGYSLIRLGHTIFAYLTKNIRISK